MFYIGIVFSILAAICFISEILNILNGDKEAADRASKDWLLLLIAALICFK